MLARIDQIRGEIKGFMVLLNESKSTLHVDNPTVKLIDETILSLDEFETVIQATRDKIINGTQLQTSLLKTCEDSTNFTQSNIRALKRMQQNSSENLKSLIVDLDKIQHELLRYKIKMEEFQEDQDIR